MSSMTTMYADKAEDAQGGRAGLGETRDNAQLLLLHTCVVYGVVS
jgi:hypothetical protein